MHNSGIIKNPGGQATQVHRKNKNTARRKTIENERLHSGSKKAQTRSYRRRRRRTSHKWQSQRRRRGRGRRWTNDQARAGRSAPRSHRTPRQRSRTSPQPHHLLQIAGLHSLFLRFPLSRKFFIAGFCFLVLEKRLIFFFNALWTNNVCQ